MKRVLSQFQIHDPSGILDTTHGNRRQRDQSTEQVHGRLEALQSRDLDNYRGEVRAVLLPKSALFCYKFRKLRIKDKFAKPATNNPGFELGKNYPLKRNLFYNGFNFDFLANNNGINLGCSSSSSSSCHSRVENST